MATARRTIITILLFNAAICIIHIAVFMNRHFRVKRVPEAEQTETTVAANNFNISINKNVRITEWEQDPTCMNHQILYPTCPPPQLDPYDPEIIKQIENHFRKQAHIPDCINSKRPKFKIDYASRLCIPSYKPPFNQHRQCYYQTFSRDEDAPDLNITYSPKSNKIYYNLTGFGEAEEFVQVVCNDTKRNQVFYTDLLHHVPKKYTVEYAMALMRRRLTEQEYANRIKVQIIGIDSVSNLNFIRYLPKSRSYLKRYLGAVEFEGLNIVGSGSYGNLVPLLTGLTTEELAKKCLPEPDSFLDRCPFIWKDFAAQGYRTSYAEDHVKYGIFTYHRKRAFRKQPTDYDLRTLAVDAERIHIGHNVTGFNKGNCWGSRLGFEVLLDNILKTAHTFQESDQWYFQFTWATALAHNFEKMLRYGDEPLLRTLKELKELKMMDDTVLIILSDHGNRLTPARNTRQGFIEAKMPALYIVLPHWFRKKYRQAMQHLRRNSHLITTHFDVHETLKHFWNLSHLEDDALERTMQDGRYANQRGISLFLPIPINRTCSSAGIRAQYCLCLTNNSVSHPLENISHYSEDEMEKDEPIGLPPELSEGDKRKNTIFGRTLAKAVVAHMNRLLAKNTLCRQLQLAEVLSLNVVEPTGSKVKSLKYLVKFETVPGNGIFEALVESINNKFQGSHVERINEHGNQSFCMSDRRLKPFCYCQPVQPSTVKRSG